MFCTIKYTTAYCLLVVAVALVVLFSACSPTATPQPTPTAVQKEISQPVLVEKPVEILSEHINYIGGGDCSADRATGDLYISPDPYCLTYDGKGVVETPIAKLANIVKKIRVRVTATVFPTEVTTSVPTAENTIIPAPTFVETSTPVPPATSTPSPEPTVKPTKTPTQVPTEVPPTKTHKPKPTEPPCQTPTPPPCNDDGENHGNHYGNDKPDNNDHDDQNKHDGENSSEDHHNEDHGNS